MNMRELMRYGIPDRVVRLWEEQESDRLLPLQELAVKRHGLLGAAGRNLLVQAPTSAGKTFIGEMAALDAALRRRKAVYCVPLKALAAEKYADFEAKYARYGLRVVISTRDHRSHDPEFENGNFDIAVVVYEKLAQLWTRRPERLREVGLVVADELELLSDEDRGAPLELLMTRLVAADLAPSPRVVGLSAVIGDAAGLAAWMNADLVTLERRPVELRYGVLHEGVFRYRTHNEFAESEEPMVNVPSDAPWEIIAENVAALTAADESCLIFVKDRHKSRRGAAALAERLSLPGAPEACQALRRLEATHSRDHLAELLAHGVAFHNADLSPEERAVVEQAFRAGEVRVLVSTSTLAAGMNLPARNVFITPEKWRYDRRFAMPWRAPLPRGEYENMGGRAGRLGAGHAFGRSILVAPSEYDRDTLWQRYVEGERESVVPQLDRYPLEDAVLRLVAAGACRTLDDLEAFLGRTLTGRRVWGGGAPGGCAVEERLRKAVDRAADDGLVTRAPDGALEATPFGWATAAKGLSCATARALALWLRESETRDWLPLDFMLAAALTPDGRSVQMQLTAREFEQAGYPAQLRARVEGQRLAPGTPLARLSSGASAPFFEEVRAIKACLCLDAWIEEAPLYDIEERYQTLAGQVQGAAGQVSWVADAAAALAVACGASDAFVSALSALAERVGRGLRVESLAATRAPGIELARNQASALGAAGFGTVEALAQAARDDLKRIVPARTAARLQAWARGQGAASPEPQAPAAGGPVLVVDDRVPDRIVIDGRDVSLQDRQYRLVRVLASSPGECVPYDRIYEAVWGDLVVEQNQLSAQKSALLRRVAEASPGRRGLVQTVPKRGFRLALDPADVCLRAAGATV